ncbi:cyclase [Actinophytocola algeriensis]|jgi:dehydratase|uniref:Dehydratase n=1 Tax=Actinophytocola algeriensis TaxID=1768010 RepID=A0A7W7VC54_9PSEU|nr:cyclase [Actinophytocola algeriensis]MBB4904680.1 dehydratase [Actinophytocola algeriensis]MBE1476461.1 dehydratase [Actinophytocola algeriensis]
MRFTLLKTGAAVVVAVTASVVLAPTASAATDIVYDCQADTPLGTENLALNQTVDATAPATVAPGGALDIVVDPAPNQVPSEAAGYTVKNVNTFTLKVPVPANATLTGVDLTGGSGLGSDPTWTESGGVVTVSFAGPIAGGATFELPTITAHLTAGASGAIDASLYGTSYDDPGLTFTAVVGTFIGDISAPTSCFPNPNPVLTSTTIA